MPCGILAPAKYGSRWSHMFQKIRCSGFGTGLCALKTMASASIFNPFFRANHLQARVSRICSGACAISAPICAYSLARKAAHRYGCAGALRDAKNEGRAISGGKIIPLMSGRFISNKSFTPKAGRENSPAVESVCSGCWLGCHVLDQTLHRFRPGNVIPLHIGKHGLPPSAQSARP